MHLQEYLCHRIEAGATPNTVKIALAAIAAAHRDAGITDPASDPGVRKTLSGLQRMSHHPKRQAKALTRTCLAAIIATASYPRVYPSGRREDMLHALRRGMVDIALVAVMRDGLLRRAEAAAIVWDDIEWAPDGSARLTIPHSKTDQTGTGAVLYIGRTAAEALATIRPDNPRPQDLVFRLQGDQIGRRIRAAAHAAGLTGEYTGHSPRVGMAIDLSSAGAELPELINAGRWTTSAMPALYTRAQDASRGAVAKYYAAGGD